MLSHTRPARSYAQRCGIAAALDAVGDRWSLLLVRDLLFGPQRFSDLADGLPGIGTNTLTARLKQLESAGVIRRRVQPLPDRGIAYELTSNGRELEPILLALGRWGARRMSDPPAGLASRSRWLVAGMLAFQDPGQPVTGPIIWELRLSDGMFTVRATGGTVRIEAGAPARADAVISIADHHLHQLLTGRLAVADAMRAGVVTVTGDPSALPRLLTLFAFPAASDPG